MTLGLFEGYGIELEYMIVDAQTLAVRPVADRLLSEVGGGYDREVALGPIAWSNELALHVVELKTNGPVAELSGSDALFQEHLGRMHALLSPLGARLMPAAMHPFMDPHRELVLWPHEDDAIYKAFDRIFDCRGHGWANLQSMHINLPFRGDEEFGRLHAAIRLVLPILPALAASSPYADGQKSAWLDTRLVHYKNNARRVPSVSGRVIPEPVYTRGDYQRVLLQAIYDDLAPLDPEGVLREEWVNARGCIARFDRSALEIRLLDVQECPRADLAIAALVIAAVRALVEERTVGHARQRGFAVEPLAAILDDTIRDAERAVIDDPDYLAAMGSSAERCTAGELWRHLFDSTLARDEKLAWAREPVSLILDRGCLARRLSQAAGEAPTRARLEGVYRELCDCLREGRLFGARA